MKKTVSILISMLIATSLIACSEMGEPSESSSQESYISSESFQTSSSYDKSPIHHSITSSKSSSTSSKTATTSSKTATTSSKTATTSSKTATTSSKSASTSSKTTTTSSKTSTSSTASNTSVATPKLIYQKINYDNSFYNNKASIDRIEIKDEKLYIDFTILEHNGGGYDTFATDAVFYDALGNIIDISQVMYASDISSKIGMSFSDYIYIPDGTDSILINSATKGQKIKVSKNHGTSSIKFEIPTICYDYDGYGSSAKVNSYNVYDGKIFFTYTVNSYSRSRSHAAKIFFYDASGDLLDEKQVLYAGKVDADAIGNTYFDYMYYPEGTAKIVIPANTPTSNASSTTGTSSTGTASDASQNEGSWSSSDISTLKSLIKSINKETPKLVSTASSFKIFATQGGSFGGGMADMYGPDVTSVATSVNRKLKQIQSLASGKQELTGIKNGATYTLSEKLESAILMTDYIMSNTLNSSTSQSVAENCAEYALSINSDCAAIETLTVLQ